MLVGDVETALTALEFRLLVAFMAAKDRVLSREHLLREVWGIRARDDTRTVDTNVKRLRQKLGPAAPVIETIRNVGYRFVELGTRAPAAAQRYAASSSLAPPASSAYRSTPCSTVDIKRRQPLGIARTAPLQRDSPCTKSTGGE